MKRSMRQLAWQWVLMGTLLVLGGATSALAQNTYPWPASGNVGIGTASPGYRLDVRGGQTRLQSTSQYPLALQAGNSGIPFSSVILFKKSDGTQLWQFGAGSLVGTRQEFGLYDDVNSAWRFYVNPSGNVGIGTASPTTKLHVAGDVQVDGNLAAKYQDVAEWVQTLTPLPPGTVVVVDHQGRNQVVPASQPYDTRVAGVVSARPGLLLGEAGEDKVKVAQSGRVPVKVDASYGPIAAGDLLVTSLTPGHAMRSTPLNLGGAIIHRPGTLLGKALEPLEEGQGEILVLLTIQ